jgi:phosphomannomutase
VIVLREALTYEPVELRFGTSGRRGEVIHLSQLEVYINVLAELEYLQSLPPSQGGIRRFDAFYLGHDLRPSSTALAPEFEGRGEIFQVVIQAVDDAGMNPASLGPVPTPAVMSYGVPRGCGSIMVTGSHIPFDRNGYKTNSSRGELRKEEEAPILRHVAAVRQRLYDEPFGRSQFDAKGMLRDGHRELPRPFDVGGQSYLDRYSSFFPPKGLKGLRLLVYEHSAVGRDLLFELLTRFGAEVVPIGRSETFVPIDTENIDDATLEEITRLAAGQEGRFDAVVSTDGDSDRPLLLAVVPGDGRLGLRFVPGDLLGMVTAEYLGADAVVVPINCNDAIELGSLRDRLEPRTRIGSPYVIAGMERAVAAGKRAVCGWEANGGFLLGSDIERNRQSLTALPTRDAFLPLLCALFAATERGITLSTLLDAQPGRYGRAGLLTDFPRDKGLAIVGTLSAGDPLVIGSVFTPGLGFGNVKRIDTLDGVRISFDNGDIAHVRPSGNADELRIYAVADTQERADEIVRLGVMEPDGLLRTLEGMA